MRSILGGLLLLACGATSAAAQDAAAQKICEVPSELIASDSALQRAADAVKQQNRLDIVVLGTGSSMLSGPGSTGMAYPARLEFALRQKLEKININVFANVQSKRTAEELLESLPKIMADRSPTLVIWQTGTVDAMRGINPDDFASALEEGIGAIQAAGADVVLMNSQYSPRTETLISATPYMDTLRVIAQKRDVPLFDRFAIMRHWNETGEFDLFGASHGLGMAKAVHDCIGRVLSDFLINAARLKSQNSKVQN